MLKLAIIGATITAVGLYYYFRPPQVGSFVSEDYVRNLNRIQNQRGDIADFEQV